MIINKGNNTIDLSGLLEEFREKYKYIYVFQFENQVFIYRAVGRKEYKDLVLDNNLTEQDKEEKLCSLCTLYPENYDFANCEEAGIPTRLAEEINKISYLDKDSRDKVMYYHRDELNDLDNQINCIICAAFPYLELEDVENWDVVTACKYFSRAEWILHNIKGVPFREKDPNADYFNTGKTRGTEEIVTDDEIKSTAKQSTVAHNGKEKNRMTPEKLAELKRKYPEIDWENDAGNLGIEGITNQPKVDTTPVALRPRGGK